MNTQQAFEKLIYNLPLLQQTGISEGTYRGWRKRLKAGTLTLDVMENALFKAGAKKIPEQWKFKK